MFQENKISKFTEICFYVFIPMVIYYHMKEASIQLVGAPILFVGGLLFLRIILGFFGSKHAKFKNFIYSPKAIWASFCELFSKKKTNYIGHNPLGGLSVFAMLFILLIQFITGLFADDDIFFTGPFSHLIPYEYAQLLTSVHKFNFNILLFLIVIHICAVFFYLIVKKDNLITPMITGKKKISKKNPH